MDLGVQSESAAARVTATGTAPVTQAEFLSRIANYPLVNYESEAGFSPVASRQGFFVKAEESA
ncbi:MAG: hypothetical protein HKUEN02_09630 [Anaerolineaceae bacterium]|nr:MAG: hypothetical protein HKUEN02_09630 [Anaerolineaceae bacterium]